MALDRGFLIRTILRLIVSGAALASAGGAALADAPDVSRSDTEETIRGGDPVAVDTVWVTADRLFPEDRAARSHGASQAIPLEQSITAAADLADLLGRGAGLQVRRTGGLGSPAVVSLRGFGPAMLQVLVNDTPVASAADGRLRLDLMPVSEFDRVEVARGDLSLRLVTRETSSVPVRVRAAGGSFGTLGLTASVVQTSGPFLLSAAAGRLQSRGDYPYLDRNGTPLNGEDDRWVRRRNNSLRQEDGIVRFAYDAGRRTRWELWTQLVRRRTGVPGTENIQTRRVRDEFLRRLSALSVERSLGSILHATVTVRDQADADRYANRDGEAGLGSTDLESRYRAGGVDAALGAASRGGALELTAGSGLAWDRWSAEDRLRGATVPGARRRTGSLSGAATVRGAGDRLTVALSHRRERAVERESDSRSIATTRLGVRFDVTPRIALSAGAGTHGRMPTFLELFGRGGVQVGNESLRPERGESVEAGVVWRTLDPGSDGVRLRAEMDFFLARGRETIHWLQNSQRTSRPENLERTRTAGAEILLRMERERLWELAVACTFLDARDVGPSDSYHGKRLPNQPIARVDSDLTLAIGGRTRATHHAAYESPVFRDRYNSPGMKRGHRLLHDLGLEVSFAGGTLGAGVTARNLTDVHTQDFLGFPLPGRSFLVHVSAFLRRR